MNVHVLFFGPSFIIMFCYYHVIFKFSSLWLSTAAPCLDWSSATTSACRCLSAAAGSSSWTAASSSPSVAPLPSPPPVPCCGVPRGGGRAHSDATPSLALSATPEPATVGELSSRSLLSLHGFSPASFPSVALTPHWPPTCCGEVAFVHHAVKRDRQDGFH